MASRFSDGDEIEIKADRLSLCINVDFIAITHLG